VTSYYVEMPRLVWPHEVIGTITEAVAAETGIPAGTPVSPGTVDAWPKPSRPASGSRAT
jgi:sugar (pentulose or hexulose) kinase